MSYDSLGYRRRAPAGYTYGCPACKDPNQLRAKDDVCRDCRALLDDAQRMREARAAQADVVAVEYSDTPHWNPYPGLKGDHSRELQDVLARLVFSVAQQVEADVPVTSLPGIEWRESGYARKEKYPVVPDLVPRGGYDTSGGQRTVLLPKAFVEAFRALWVTVKASSESAYAAGFQKGRNLLTGLASGEVSIKEYNDLTVDS